MQSRDDIIHSLNIVCFFLHKEDLEAQHKPLKALYRRNIP